MEKEWINKLFLPLLNALPEGQAIAVFEQVPWIDCVSSSSQEGN